MSNTCAYKRWHMRSAPIPNIGIIPSCYDGHWACELCFLCSVTPETHISGGDGWTWLKNLQWYNRADVLRNRHRTFVKTLGCYSQLSHIAKTYHNRAQEVTSVKEKTEFADDLVRPRADVAIVQMCSPSNDFRGNQSKTPLWSAWGGGHPLEA